LGVFAIGDVIDGRYEILSPLAEGGMGAVYRARRLLLGDEVAIKVVLPDLTTSTARERFLRESRVAASLRHPAVVAILDFDMPPTGQPFLVMELLNGPSLRDELHARGRLDIVHVQQIIPGICSALHLAHSQGIVHRDIKPANIVSHEYAGAGRVYKLVDFGIANLRQGTDETRLTGEDQFLGTVTYAAPEQLARGDADARSDVYSLAAVVFEMLAGHPPFPGVDVMSIVSAHLSTPPPRLRTLRPELPPWIEEVVARGLVKLPAERWQTAAEFGEALKGPTGHIETRTDNTKPLTVSVSGLIAVYDIGEAIGPGRLGSRIFRGTHRALGHPVAIRILESTVPNWSAVRERFLREAQSLQVAHPSILQVRDYGEEQGFVYLVTDFIEGTTLRAVLREEGAMPWSRLRPLLQQLLEAARVLHRRKALLCGLNPDIMRIRPADPNDPEAEDTERVMISTGGIWRAQDLLATLHDGTLRGQALEDGELRYVAPELLTGGMVDVRSDIFTIGILAYEMATGKPPFDGASMPELLGRMLAGAVPDPRAVANDLPEASAAAILRALSPTPAQRFGTVKEFAAAVF
jgi:serine/threonine-protein kinase